MEILFKLKYCIAAGERYNDKHAAKNLPHFKILAQKNGHP